MASASTAHCAATRKTTTAATVTTVEKNGFQISASGQGTHLARNASTSFRLRWRHGAGPIRRLPVGSIQQRPALRRDQQRRRPAPSGRKGSTGNRSPKRPHSPPTAANFSSDCLALSVVETVISSSNQRIFGSNVTLTCPAGMEFATGVKRITTAAGPARLLRAGAPNRQRIRHRVQQRDFWRRGPVPVTATPDSDWLPARPSKPSAARETASGQKFTAESGSSWSVSPRSSARPAALGTPPHRNASRPSSCLWRKTSPAADTNQLVPYGQNISLTCNEPGRPLANTPTASFRQCVYHPRPGFPQYWLSGAQPSSPRIDCAKAAETPGAEYGFFPDTRATSPASSSNASRLSWN